MADNMWAAPFSPPSAVSTLINAAAVDTNSANITPGAYHRTLNLDVQGDAVGYFTVEGRMQGTTWNPIRRVYNDLGQRLVRGKRNGLFQVPIGGLATVRVRAFLLAGAMTIYGNTSMDEIYTAPEHGFQLIDDSYRVTIPAASGVTVFSGVTTTGRTMLRTGFIVDDETAAFTTRVEVAPGLDRDLNAATYLGTLAGNPDDWIVWQSAAVGRGSSDWGAEAFVPGDNVSVKWWNDDPANAHTYDCFLETM